MLCYHSASNTSYFWIDGMFGVVGTDFFRISFLAILMILAVVFTVLLLKQRDKVTVL
jgi:Na+/proline symporter